MENLQNGMGDDEFDGREVLAVRECLIYPKNNSYAVVKFGKDYKCTAIAIPSVMYSSGRNRLNIRKKFLWGHPGYMNCRRIGNGIFKGVSWLCTLVWKSKERKPFGSCMVTDEDWESLLDEFSQLDHDLDISLETGPQGTMKDIAKSLFD